jgi:3-phosphoglycerate kinase
MKPRRSPGVEVPRLARLEDLLGSLPATARRALVRATLDLPLSADPRDPLACHRARLLAETATWLRQHGLSVTIAGDVGAGGPGEGGDGLSSVRRTMASFLGAEVSEVVFAPCDEDPRSIDDLVASHDVFVNDTLQESILPLPSLLRPPQRLPSAIGRTVEHDLDVVARLLVEPPRPLVAVLGGERPWQRLHGLEGLVLRADAVLLGGALALPMIRAVGHHPDGSSEGAPIEPSDEFAWECRHVYGLSRRVHHRIVLPTDVVLAGPGQDPVAAQAVAAGADVTDIGPVTRVRFCEVLDGARSVLWTGALGRVEDGRFEEGTRTLAERLTHQAGRLVVLGGDALVRFLAERDLLSEEAHVLSSTDGAIELLKNGDLPALAALRAGRADR